MLALQVLVVWSALAVSTGTAVAVLATGAKRIAAQQGAPVSSR